MGLENSFKKSVSLLRRQYGEDSNNQPSYKKRPVIDKLMCLYKHNEELAGHILIH